MKNLPRLLGLEAWSLSVGPTLGFEERDKAEAGTEHVVHMLPKQMTAELAGSPVLH